MKTHQYDSDALRDDLIRINDEESNLYNICNGNKKFISTSKQFITNIECMFVLFNEI